MRNVAGSHELATSFESRAAAAAAAAADRDSWPSAASDDYDQISPRVVIRDHIITQVVIRNPFSCCI